MHILQCEVVGGGVSPHITQALVVLNGGQGLCAVFGLLPFLGQSTPETALIAPLQTNGSLSAQCQALDGFPVERQAIGVGISMLDHLVDVDIAPRVGQIKHLLFVRISIAWVDIAELTQTVGRTVAQHIDDTAGTDVITTGALVTTEGELRIELHGQFVRQLHISLEIDICTTHAGTKDNTLILTLCQREVEFHLVRAATNSHVGRIVQRGLAHHLVLPVVGGQGGIHIQIVGVAEIGLVELSRSLTGTLGSMPLILVGGKLLSIHQVKFLSQMTNLQVGVERHLHLAFLGTLGGHHHNAITTLGTIDGGQGGILQHVDRRNISRGDIVDIIHLETIDNIKWFVGLGH